MCYSIAFVENCMNFASILSMLMITTERYYVICNPLKVKSVMSQSRTFKIIIFIWFISISCNLPWIFLTEYYVDRFSDNEQLDYRCGHISRGNWTFSYMILTTFVFYALIGIILIFLYYKISESLKNSNKFLVINAAKKYSEINSKTSSSFNCLTEEIEFTETSHSYQNNNNANMHVAHDMTKKDMSKLNSKRFFATKKPDLRVNKGEIDNKAIKNRKKLISMIMWVIVAFYVCLTPIKAWNLSK